MGVEPTSPAWEAGVMTVIRRPLAYFYYRVLHKAKKVNANQSTNC